VDDSVATAMPVSSGPRPSTRNIARQPNAASTRPEIRNEAAQPAAGLDRVQPPFRDDLRQGDGEGHQGREAGDQREGVQGGDVEGGGAGGQGRAIGCH